MTREITDGPPVDGLAAREVEAAYRRGYAQGAYHGVRVAQEEPPAKRTAWLNALMQWRYDISLRHGEERVRATWPPRP